MLHVLAPTWEAADDDDDDGDCSCGRCGDCDETFHWMVSVVCMEGVSAGGVSAVMDAELLLPMPFTISSTCMYGNGGGGDL